MILNFRITTLQKRMIRFAAEHDVKATPVVDASIRIDGTDAYGPGKHAPDQFASDMTELRTILGY